MQVEIRRKSIVVTEEIQTYIKRRLSFALGRFASRISRIKVHIEDTNGPRGGIDKHCTLVVQMKSGGAIVLEENGAELPSLIDLASDRLGRCVQRALERRRPDRVGQKREPIET